MLSRLAIEQPASAQSNPAIVQRLQRRYGNRYVQGLMKQIDYSSTEEPTHVGHEPTLAAVSNQRQPAGDEVVEINRSPDEKDESWSSELKTDLGEQKSLYHTVNNFGKTPTTYVLRATNRGHALVSLETQFDEDRKWIAFSVQRGKTEQATYQVWPQRALHLRLFGERDYTAPDQSYVEGTLEVFRE